WPVFAETMNTLLLNRDGFQMPTDGWYQVAPLGEFAHAQAGLVQVVDPEACAAMVNRFADEAKDSNFAGLLVDFDHFSLDGEKRSEAAGWITALENRDGGLFAKIRWSDVGEEAVKGGRYRFLSPVWSRSDCVDLGNGRVRPVRLLNAAVTNDPNLKGMQPLSNSATAAGAPRFKWVLGETPEGRHCPSCTAVAGQVHTMAEWDAAGVKPGAAVLCCQGNCKCRLDPTGDPAGGDLKDVPVRKDDVIENRSGVPAPNLTTPALCNTGWTNEARTASLEVRRAKALRRAQGGAATRDARLRERQQASMEKASKDYAAIFEAKGLDGMSPEEVTYMTARVGRRIQNGSALTDTEKRFVREMNDRGAGDGLGGKEKAVVQNSKRETASDALANIGWTDAARAASLAVRQAKAGARGGADGGVGAGAGSGRSAVISLLSKGYSSMTPDEVRKFAKALQAKAKTGSDFTPEELTFLQDSIDDPNIAPQVDQGIYIGGSKNFDESTGQYRNPVGGAAPGRTVQPTYPVKPGQPLPLPYVPPSRGTPQLPVKRPVPRKKGQTVPATPPYRFLASRARRAGCGLR
ncbi:MAG: phage protease, partial [bacterium]